MFTKCGETSDGKIVVSGVYKFYETYGLPLDIICEELEKKQMVPAWDVFFLDAIKSGVNERKAVAKIFEYINTKRKHEDA